MFGGFKQAPIQKKTIVVKRTNPNASTGPNGVKRAQSTPNLKPPSATTTTSARKISPRPSPRPAAKPARASTPPRSRIVKKRKASTPPPVFASSEDESEDELPARKRSRTTESEEPDTTRDIWKTKVDPKGRASRIIHAAQLVVGNGKKLLKPIFEGLEDVGDVELEYPTNAPPERFKLMMGRESEAFKATDDIRQTIEHICTHYFPPAKSEELLTQPSGFVNLLRSALVKNSYPDFVKTVSDFNAFMRASRNDGTIDSALATKRVITLPLVERILSQCTARTVSPHVHLLKKYENGGDNVYGELLPRLVHQMFREAKLDSKCVFIDLGSGVGNVVLQAALETGAESWGIEMMPNPVKLAAAQGAEFKARCALWGIKPGATHLLDGDFVENAEISEQLKRADVVLVNNYAFDPSLNEKLLWKFLDLKEGARIISLKTFVPDKWQLKPSNMHDVRNTLKVQHGNWHSQCVSWTDAPGDYYIATKDHSAIREFEKKQSRRRG